MKTVIEYLIINVAFITFDTPDIHNLLVFLSFQDGPLSFSQLVADTKCPHFNFLTSVISTTFLKVKAFAAFSFFLVFFSLSK